MFVNQAPYAVASWLVTKATKWKQHQVLKQIRELLYGARKIN